ncbi:MAG: TIGR03013 family PEP-CTERM/XrtA system glycosyltransferase [Nitrosomonas sp.]|nr:TIGR03013 family PEP-CTERM/XrtA system glycosyltransferase [Nitrosomonas sp.]MBK7363992.1 TIGR03013 family PEP-CTERM/XrtA system glycosyltransferase [Nitrosomonas sp.]
MTVFYVGVGIRYVSWGNIEINLFLSELPGALTFAFVIITSMAAMGMYQSDFKLDFESILLRLMPAFALSFAIMTFIFYVLPDLYFGRGLLAIAMILAFALLLLLRMLFFRLPGVEFFRPRAIVLGTGNSAHELYKLIAEKSFFRNHNIVGYVPFYGEERKVPVTAIIEKNSNLGVLAAQKDVSEVIVATQERRGGGFPIQELLECKMNGINVMDIATFYEKERGYIRMDSLQPSWLVFGRGFDQSLIRSLIKRIFDLCASILLLIVTLPVMLITIIIIFLEDGKPIFYRQARIGRGGTVFSVIKFRSMRKDAEKGGRPQWSTEDDPRITRIGKIIRKLRIDELPQIINVLKGEMSFVGPRPERPYFVDMLIAQVPYYNIRHSVKPGITGWAQVRYPYGSSVEDSIEKLQYDLYYVKNHSLFLDLIILIDTVGVVLLGKGGR